MLPKLSAPGVTCSCDCAPIPVSGTVSGRVVALVVRLRVPVRVPMAVGVKVIWKVHVEPAARVDWSGGQVSLVVA